MPTEPPFTRHFHVFPAFDCPDGKCDIPECAGLPLAHPLGHGIGAEQWSIVLSTSGFLLQLVVDTGRYLRANPRDLGYRQGDEGRTLRVHFAHLSGEWGSNHWHAATRGSITCYHRKGPGIPDSSGPFYPLPGQWLPEVSAEDLWRTAVPGQLDHDVTHPTRLPDSAWQVLEATARSELARCEALRYDRNPAWPEVCRLSKRLQALAGRAPAFAPQGTTT